MQTDITYTFPLLQVMEEVLPLLANVRIPDPDIIMRTVRKYGKPDAYTIDLIAKLLVYKLKI